MPSGHQHLTKEDPCKFEAWRSSSHELVEIAAKLECLWLARRFDWCLHRKPDTNGVSQRPILPVAVTPHPKLSDTPEAV